MILAVWAASCCYEVVVGSVVVGSVVVGKCSVMVAAGVERGEDSTKYLLLLLSCAEEWNWVSSFMLQIFAFVVLSRWLREDLSSTLPR